MEQTGTYSNMDILRDTTFHSLCCVKSTRKVNLELKYFINDALEDFLLPDSLTCITANAKR